MTSQQGSVGEAGRHRIFYGWWIVLGNLVLAVVSWSLTQFGMGAYVHALAEHRGFSIGSISMAVTLSYLVSAACLISVGAAITRWGPKAIVAGGTLVLAITVATLGFCQTVWQVFLVFAVMGLGRACLSPTSISVTIAPWFERHQGRAVSIALLGASVGGMTGTPFLLAAVGTFGLRNAFMFAAALSLVLVLPIVLFVFKNKPQDLGLLPDGEEFVPGNAPKVEAAWSRKGAMSTRQFRSLTIAFALGMMVQVGFLSSHVSLVAPVSGNYGASVAVSSAALAAFIGRIALAQFADRIDLRLTTGAVMLVAAASLTAMAATSSPTGLLLTSASYGLTIGNLTTLSPIISRREFGAASFGATYGVAAAVISFATAFGPGLFGILRDFLGSYGPGLIAAAVLNLIAAAIIIWGGLKPLPPPF